MAEANPADVQAALAVKADRTALEATVAKGLAALNGDEPAEAEAEVEEEVETPAEGEEGAEAAVEKEEGEEEEEVETEGGEEGEQEEVEEAAAPVVNDPKAPTLPAAYRRSLKAIGWEDAEIDENMKAIGPKFIETAAKFHKSRVEETARWAQMGRQARQTTQTQQPAADEFKAIEKLDAAALKEHYGEDALVDAILNPVNAAIDRINKMVPTIQATQRASQAAEMETLATAIEGFFGSTDIKPYEELYGKAGTKAFKEEHLQARNNVLELADALIAGAKQQGRPLGLSDALLIAHDSLSGDFKVKAARKTITKTLKNRERGISLKPGSKVSTPAAVGGAPKSRAELESSTAKKLKALFA